MLDFLEHLPDLEAARHMVAKFAHACRDFLFIRHPSFEDIDYLAHLGLKITWTDWSAHPNMMRIEDFRRMFDEWGWTDYEIRPHMPIADSEHPAILPITAPGDTQQYDATRHGPRPRITFDRPVYGKYDIFVRLNPDLDPALWQRITTMHGWEAMWESAVVGSPSSTPGRRSPSSGLKLIFDPWLGRSGRPLPDIPDFLDDYLDRHVKQCVKLQDFFFLRLAHLMDAIGRIGEPMTRVCSVGPGLGFQEAFLAGRFPEMQVTGIDKTLRNLPFPMPNLEFRTGDILENDGSEQFDLVFSIECLEHIEDYQLAFRHLARLVRPGGYLYLAVPFASKDQQGDAKLCARLRDQFGHVTPGFDFDDLEAMFHRQGLDVLHASNVFHRDVVLPVREIMKSLSAEEIDATSGAIARLLLLDLQDRRVMTSHESEGIRFLGRMPD